MVRTVAADALPSSLVAALAALDPNAVPVESVDIDREECGPQARQPSHLAADFNGDGRTDYAMYVRSKRPPRGSSVAVRYTVRFVIFLGRPDDRFEPTVIGEELSTLPLQTRLVLQPPGRIRDVEGDRVVHLRHPGVVHMHCGKAASTYFWVPRSRGFEYIVTAD